MANEPTSWMPQVDCCAFGSAAATVPRWKSSEVTRRSRYPADHLVIDREAVVVVHRSIPSIPSMIVGGSAACHEPSRSGQQRDWKRHESIGEPCPRSRNRLERNDSSCLRG